MPHQKTVADILEENAESALKDWLTRVGGEQEIIAIEMTAQERGAHLPDVFRDIVARLRDPLPLGTHALMSDAAYDHGIKRREQGYTPAMMVNESRMLQVSIFETLQANLPMMDSGLLLGDIMTIADEVDSQLAQAMSSYIIESKRDGDSINS